MGTFNSGSKGGALTLIPVVKSSRRGKDTARRCQERRQLEAVSFYEEHVFHDNLEDATWFHTHMKEIAESAAKGLCEYFGIPYVEKEKPEPVEPEEPTVLGNILLHGVDGDSGMWERVK